MNEEGPQYDPPVGNPTADNGAPPASPSGPAQPSGTPPPAGAQPGSPQPPAQPQGDWVSRHHLNEVWRAHRQSQDVIKQLQTELQGLKTPKAPPVPPDERMSAIRAELYKVAPELEWLTKVDRERIEKMLERFPDLEANAEHTWTVAANGYLRSIGETLEKWYGQVDPKARRWAETNFIDWVTNDPAAHQRYIQQDPTLAQEFLKAFESLFLDPVRRRAAAVENERGTRRAALPRPGPRTAALGQGPPPQPKNEDERHDFAWERLQAQR